MKSIPEKEILFNRFYHREMDKAQLSVMVKQLMWDKELRGCLQLRWNLNLSFYKKASFPLTKSLFFLYLSLAKVYNPKY